MPRLAILGGGFMGGALAEGLIDSGWNRKNIVVAEVREARRQFLTEFLRLQTTKSITEAVESADTLLLAVKPQDVGGVLAEVAKTYTTEKLVISICAGIETKTIEAALQNAPVIRSMPNTPAAIGLGATAIARGAHAGNEHLTSAINIFSTVGKVVVVEENQMDAVTAVSGTGPAYVFLLVEALIDAARDEGLGDEQAHVLAYQTVLGAARLLVHDASGPAELRARVTSPGGTTHAAMTFLEARKWTETFREAVHRARVRSAELGE